MSPVTHLLVGWSVASGAALSRRDRAIVTVAGVAPDADAFGIVAEALTRNSDKPLLWWSTWHHVLGHNVGFALAVAVAAALAATRRTMTASLALLSFHLHLLGDFAGARGPEGYQWPIPYLLPFSGSFPLVWSGQWALNGWPNFLLTAVLLALALYLAWRRGHSPLEMVSPRADRRFVETLRNRFGPPPAGQMPPDLSRDIMTPMEGDDHE